MMKCGLITAASLLVSAVLLAQEPAEDAPVPESAPVKKKVVEQEKPRDIRYLSKPFSRIRTNILDLERAGYFAIDAVNIRPRGTGDEAIVWTVRVRKPVTYRHTEAMLREFRDARFYSTTENRKFEVITTLVNYSDRLSNGSANGKLLGQDDVFELWIDLPTVYFQKLKSLDADTLVLRRWRY
jgi:hypothetical protein